MHICKNRKSSGGKCVGNAVVNCRADACCVMHAGVMRQVELEGGWSVCAVKLHCWLEFRFHLRGRVSSYLTLTHHHCHFIISTHTNTCLHHLALRLPHSTPDPVGGCSISCKISGIAKNQKKKKRKKKKSCVDYDIGSLHNNTHLSALGCCASCRTFLQDCETHLPAYFLMYVGN